MNLALLFAHIQILGLQRLKGEQIAQSTLMTSSSCMHADAAQQNSRGASNCVHTLSDLTSGVGRALNVALHSSQRIAEHHC